jgi:hypothetical protein
VDGSAEAQLDLADHGRRVPVQGRPGDPQHQPPEELELVLAVVVPRKSSICGVVEEPVALEREELARPRQIEEDEATVGKSNGVLPHRVVESGGRENPAGAPLELAHRRHVVGESRLQQRSHHPGPRTASPSDLYEPVGHLVDRAQPASERIFERLIGALPVKAGREVEERSDDRRARDRRDGVAIGVADVLGFVEPHVPPPASPRPTVHQHFHGCLLDAVESVEQGGGPVGEERGRAGSPHRDERSLLPGAWRAPEAVDLAVDALEHAVSSSHRQRLGGYARLISQGPRDESVVGDRDGGDGVVDVGGPHRSSVKLFADLRAPVGGMAFRGTQVGLVSDGGARHLERASRSRPSAGWRTQHGGRRGTGQPRGQGRKWSSRGGGAAVSARSEADATR